MRAECEVTVLSEDLIDATRHFLDWYSAQRGRCPDCITLEPCEIGLRIVTPMLAAEIPVKGRWTRSVETSGHDLATLAKLIGPGHAVVIGFAGDRVYVNRTSILALEVTARPEPVLVGEQDMLPGMVPVSPQERLQHRVTQPLRPRVGQRGLAGTTLFGK